jgi:serine phosphatase RsbU (regulator of sigma subunit)
MEIWGGNEADVRALSVPGLDVWVTSVPAGATGSGGGDLHYISTCGAGKIARLVVADVAGHGANVSDTSNALRKLLRRNINKLDQTRFVRALNRQFHALSGGGRFATAILASYFAPSDHLVVCNAGHPRPLWYHAPSKEWRVLTHDDEAAAGRVHNLPLGVITPTPYFQFAVELALGDLVLLYTDAAIEATNERGEMLGDAGLWDMVHTLDPSQPAEFSAQLFEKLRAFRACKPFEDDMTLMLLHHNGSNPPRQSLSEFLTVLGKVAHLVKV